MRDGSTRRAEASELLERITGGLRGEDEQLLALAAALEREVELPADAYVIGEPVEVIEIRYGGSPRTGLRATCRRGEEQHVVGLAPRLLGKPGEACSLGARFRGGDAGWPRCRQSTRDGGA